MMQTFNGNINIRNTSFIAFKAELQGAKTKSLQHIETCYKEKVAIDESKSLTIHMCLTI